MRGIPGGLADGLAYRVSLLLLVLLGVFLEAAQRAAFQLTRRLVPATSQRSSVTALGPSLPAQLAPMQRFGSYDQRTAST